MMKRLGQRIHAEMDRRGKNGKSIAAAVHDYMVAKLGDSADKHETVPGKLSKLLHDKPEGVAYFYAQDHVERLEGLADALGVDVAALRDWRTEDSVPTLVLDPRLDPAAIRFISAQADDRAARYRVVIVGGPAGSGDDGAVDTAIRAEIIQHPQSIAVVSTIEAARMFAFAEHSVTMVHSVPRGYVLDAFPDLVPIPAPPAPRLFDEAGLPILPVEPSTAPRDAREPLGHELDEIERRCIAPARSRGEVPCLSLRDALTWNTRVGGPLRPCVSTSPHYDRKVCPVTVCSGPSVRLEHLIANEAAQTLVWVEGQRIFAIGSHAAAVAELFAPHHSVTEPGDMQALRARLKSTPPWQLLDEAERPEDPLHPLLKELTEWTKPHRDAWLAGLLAQPRDEVARLLPHNEQPIRERLLELATYGAAPFSFALLLALGRAADAPLIAFEPQSAASDHQLAVVADLGGGHLLRIRMMRMPGRRSQLKQRPLPDSEAERLWRECAPDRSRLSIYDGGDVLISVVWITDVNLEGWSPPARRRRADNDSWHWDDD